MSVNRLNRRPLMTPDELLEYFVLRSLRSNAVFDLQEAKRLMPSAALSFGRFGTLNTSDGSSVIQALEPLFDRKVVDEDEYNTLDAQRFPSNDQWCINSTRITKPRICVDCANGTDTAFPWYWQSPLVSTCPVHQKPLITHCPCCDEPLKWHLSIQTQCSNCFATWHSMSFRVVRTAPTPLEQTIVSSVMQNKMVDPAFIKDLMRAILSVARPFDYELKPLRSMPHSRRLSELIHLAYGLISSLSFRLHLRSARVEALDDVLLFEYQYDGDDFNEVFTSTLSRKAFGALDDFEFGPQTLIEEESFIHPGVGSIKGLPADAARYFVTDEGFGKILGINPSEVPLLASNANLKRYGGLTAKPKLWNTRELKAKVKSILVSTPPTGTLTLVPDDPNLSRSLDTYANFMGFVLSGRYNGSISTSHGFTAVHVDRGSFENYAWQNFMRVCAGYSVKIQDAARCLGVSIEEIDALVKAGHLDYKRSMKNHIRSDSLKKYRLKQITREKAIRARNSVEFVTF